MTFYKQSALLFLLVLIQSSVYDGAVVKRDSNESGISGSSIERSFFGGPEERNLEQEILQEINHLSSRKQREIFDDLEKQHEQFNASRSLALTEPENLSPLNVEELKNIRKTIKSSNSSLPAIRNKRTLNFLLYAVARAMGYTLTPTNPDAEWIPRQQPPPAQPPPAQPSSPPCSTPPPPCRPNPPPSTPPPCPMPPTTPPCPGSGALMQPATIPPNQIDANTISYPYRPARTIPLFNFAPLPAGIRVPYPPLLQPPAQQRSSCPPQQPSPPPCGTTPAPSPPPCMATPAPKAPPCRPTPPPCSTPPPPPCGTTPAPPPPPCKATPAPPCGTTPAPRPPPCATTPAPPPPCNAPPSPPPCTTTPKPPPCGTPAPPPCGTPAPPPCGTPAPPPCGNPPPPPPPPSAEPPKKGSILLEYDDPVRIQIFSNEKKYLPASGNIFSGHDIDEKDDWHSHSAPYNEKARKKDDDYEEKEEMEEEHIEEEEEEEEAPGQLKHYEEEDERNAAQEEEDESETNLSVVKKPAEMDIKKVKQRRLVSSKTKAAVTADKDKKNEKEEKPKEGRSEKPVKMKAPKRKKWVRIVKKQRRKTKTDSSPHENFQIYSSDSFPDSSRITPRFYGRKNSRSDFDSLEGDVSDYSSDSSSRSSEDITQVDVKKVIVNNKALQLPHDAVEDKRYEFNINPYALEPESERRKKLEQAVERYVEDYVEKQLGAELIKNTGVPKTTVFEFAPKNGPKIQTITTTVAKTSHSGVPANFKPQIRPETSSSYIAPKRNGPVLRETSYQETFSKRGDDSYEGFEPRD